MTHQRQSQSPPSVIVLATCLYKCFVHKQLQVTVSNDDDDDDDGCT